MIASDVPLKNLRNLSERVRPPLSRDLARLTTYTPESWQPALYVSYRMFGTTRWADEIVAMNPHIRHLLLVPPGMPLRVIKHD